MKGGEHSSKPEFILKKLFGSNVGKKRGKVITLNMEECHEKIDYFINDVFNDFPRCLISSGKPKSI